MIEARHSIKSMMLHSTGKHAHAIQQRICMDVLKHGRRRYSRTDAGADRCNPFDCIGDRLVDGKFQVEKNLRIQCLQRLSLSSSHSCLGEYMAKACARREELIPVSYSRRQDVFDDDCKERTSRYEYFFRAKAITWRVAVSVLACAKRSASFSKKQSQSAQCLNSNVDCTLVMVYSRMVLFG